MDLRLSGFMQGHYPPSLASSKAWLSPDGSVIPNLLGEKRGFSWLRGLRVSAAWRRAWAAGSLQALCSSLIWRRFVEMEGSDLAGGPGDGG